MKTKKLNRPIKHLNNKTALKTLIKKLLLTPTYLPKNHKIILLRESSIEIKLKKAPLIPIHLAITLKLIQTTRKIILTRLIRLEIMKFLSNINEKNNFLELKSKYFYFYFFTT